jgi:hypothetical protein
MLMFSALLVQAGGSAYSSLEDSSRDRRDAGPGCAEAITSIRIWVVRGRSDLPVSCQHLQCKNRYKNISSFNTFCCPISFSFCTSVHNQEELKYRVAKGVKKILKL